MGTIRKNIMLGTAGHVDHGKTALVKLLTGCDTDTLAEERARGLTIDLGFAPCRLPGDRVVGIVDVPGHVDFIRHMVAGAHGIDVVMFVVAADDGVMPQSREHLDILTLMGLRHGLVALTKIDLVDSGRREEVVADVRRLLAGTFLESALICPMSNMTGEGFDQFFDALDGAVDLCEERRCSGLFRAWVADAFTIRGFGTVVTAIPSSGRVRVGDRLRVAPGSGGGHVRRLEVYGEDALEGRAGECVAVNLPELEHGAVKRGMVVTESDAVAPVNMVEGELRLLATVTGQLKDYTPVHLHVGTASVLAHVALLESDELRAGQSRMVQLRLCEPLAIVPGERFVIRCSLPGAGGCGLATIGGGRILGVSNLRLRRRRPWTIETLRARRDAIDDSRRWSEQVLRENARPLSVADWAGLSFRKEAELRADIDALGQDNIVLQTAGGAFVHAECVRQARVQLLAAVEAMHAAQPRRVGFEAAELVEMARTLGGEPGQQLVPPRPGEVQTIRGQRRAVAGNCSLSEDSVIELVLENLVKTEQLERRGALLAKTGWQVQLSPEEEAIAERVASAFKRSALTPPRPEELARTLGLADKRVASAAKLLTEREVLVRVGPGMLFHRDAVATAQDVAVRLFERAGSFSTMEFRDALGVSRKHAVPLLDYLDATRFTVRSGNLRTPGVVARGRLG